MRRAPTLPTESELAILRVLWRRGPSTVREVQASLEQDRPTGYTTALKFLQIMFEKGLVQRDESSRTHVYRARSTEQQTRRQLLRDLADRAFDGSTADLIKEALAMKAPTREEAAELRRLLKPVDEARRGPAGQAVQGEDSEDAAGSGRLF
jgi:BlaI family transcriptional regulator, penicillinase repressor